MLILPSLLPSGKSAAIQLRIELVIPDAKRAKYIRLNGWIVRLCQTGIGVTFKRILERRSGKERRSDLDRRNGFDRRDRRRRKADANLPG